MTAAFLAVLTGHEGYGVARVWQQLIRGLSSKGRQPVLAVLDATRAELVRQQYPGLEVLVPPANLRPYRLHRGHLARFAQMAGRTIVQMQLAGWLTHEARARNIAAVVVQSPLETFLAGIVARQIGVQALWLVPNAIGNGVPLDLNRRVYRSIFNHLGVVPVSNSAYTDSTFGPGKYERHIVPLGVDLAEFFPVCGMSVRDLIQVPRDAKLFGCFARMTPSKGQDRLIEALDKLNEDVYLLLCGGPIEGPYYDMLRDKLLRLSIGPRVHIAGPQPEMAPYFAACDVIVNARVDPEPFGLTIIEGMASGKPVLAHIAGGPSDIILDGETGWLMPDVEIGTLTNALQRVLSDESRWHHMGQLGRRRVENNFGRDRFVEAIDDLIFLPGAEPARPIPQKK